jgi:hypothetical protein
MGAGPCIESGTHLNDLQANEQHGPVTIIAVEVSMTERPE